MKLLFVHQHFGDFGGAEADLHLTGRELRERGHRIALLYREPTGRNENQWRTTFAEIFHLPSRGNLEVVEAVLDQFGPDLVYLNNLDDLAVLESLLGSGLPVVRVVHDHSLYCMRQYKYNYFTRRICTRPASPYCVFPCLASVARNRQGPLPFKWVSYAAKRRELRLNQRCRCLVVYSDYMKAELLQNGFSPEQIAVCSPIRAWQDEDPTNSLSSRNLVLFAGQIIRGKGVDLLLKALARVGVPFECVLLGEGSHRAYCERLCARLGLNERVRFLGYVPPAELKHFYLEASVCAVSSVWPEPFGLAGIEALRYGVPVVAFDAGATREWLHDGKNGFLAPWKDTATFAARLEDLLRNKELARQMGRRGREWVRRRDAAGSTNALEKLFQRVVQQTLESNQDMPTNQPICL